MANGYEQRILICSECGEEFVFTAQAQEYFTKQGWIGNPRKCKACHAVHRKVRRFNNLDTATPRTTVIPITNEGGRRA